MSGSGEVEQASPEFFIKRLGKFTLPHIKKIAAWAAAVWLGLLGLLMLLGRIVPESPREITLSEFLEAAIALGSIILFVSSLFLLRMLELFKSSENNPAQDVKAETSPIAKRWHGGPKEIRTLGSEIYANIIAPLLFLAVGLAVLGLIVWALFFLFSAAPWWAALIILLLIVLILK